MLHRDGDEWSQGESGLPLVTVTMQHLAFDEYVGAVSDSMRREWAKVQGRFEDIPYIDTPLQTRMLIGSAWQASSDERFRAALQEWAERHYRLCRSAGLSELFDSPEQIASCWPLHPVAQLVLPELCSRYGQNERTLFSFLAGREPLSVASYLAETEWAHGQPLPDVSVGRLWDYFVESASTMIGVAHRASRWVEIDVLIRDATGIDDAERVTLKTIGLLNLVSAGGALRATRQVVEYASPISAKTVRTIVGRLEGRGLLTFRDFADEYRLWQGSDFDLRAAIDAARRRLRTTPPASLCSRVRPLSPLVAGRHSQQTFTLRAFSRMWTDGSSSSVQPPAASEAIDGLVAYCVDRTRALPELNASEGSSKPVLAVMPNDPEPLIESAIEVAAVQEVLASEERLETDWVARRELAERVAEGMQSFDAEFERAFGPTSGASWAWLRIDGPPAALDLTKSVSSGLSAVADLAYSEAPRVRNEMLNRTELTSQGAKARRELLQAMLTSAAVERLDIEGFGPEAAMYEAALRESGLHRSMPDGRWGFAPPSAEDFVPSWAAIEEEFSRATDHRIGLDQVLRRLASPPYGVRAGVAPVLVTAALLVHSDDIAIYEHGTYRAALTPDLSERMVRNPAHFELKQFATRWGVRGHVVAELADVLGIRPSTRSQRNGTVVGILSHLVASLIVPLPEYSRRTNRLSESAVRVRQALLTATEPDELLFNLLPSAVGFPRVPASAPKERWPQHAVWIDPLVDCLAELQEAYPKLLREIEAALVETTGSSRTSLRSGLAGRVSNIEIDVVDARLRAFLNAIDSTLDDEEWLVYVASTVAGTPPAAWTNDDVTRFLGSVRDLGGRLRRIEALHYSRRAQDGIPFDAVRATFTHPDGQEDDRVVWVDERHREALEPALDRFLAEEFAPIAGSSDAALDSLIALLARRRFLGRAEGVTPIGDTMDGTKARRRSTGG